jgi:hypothetical protein
VIFDDIRMEFQKNLEVFWLDEVPWEREREERERVDVHLK